MDTLDWGYENKEDLDFQMLVILCKEKHIKVGKGETRLTLLEKLNTKAKRGK